MNAVPHIIVQLVHIEGPLKGEIQELSDVEIAIGRHPDCQVQYPKDMATLSRKHARIVREGNRFKIIDQSTNGTFINGKPVAEAYLKDGDVITLAEGGPKFSFLTQISDMPAPEQPAATSRPAPAPEQPTPPSTPRPARAQQTPVSPPQPAPAPPGPVPPTPPAYTPHTPAGPQPAAPDQAHAAPAIQEVKMPFAIQYGPALKSFQSLPITLGRGSQCDFVINHAALNEQQAQIFFARDQYWIKDLTGSSAVSINGMPIAGQSPLQPDAQVSLSPQGPKFRFLGGGRMAEIEDPLPASQPPREHRNEPAQPAKHDSGSIGQKAGTLFKKFFS